MFFSQKKTFKALNSGLKAVFFHILSYFGLLSTEALTTLKTVFLAKL
jgi:hypothetical protein